MSDTVLFGCVAGVVDGHQHQIDRDSLVTHEAPPRAEPPFSCCMPLPWFPHDPVACMSVCPSCSGRVVLTCLLFAVNKCRVVSLGVAGTHCSCTILRERAMGDGAACPPVILDIKKATATADLH